MKNQHIILHDTNQYSPTMIEHIFKQVKELQELDEFTKEQLIQNLNFQKLPKGKLVLTEGDICNKLWFVHKGLLRGFYYKNNDEVTTWFAKETDFISPLSFLKQQKSIESIEVLENSEVIFIEYQKLQNLYEKNLTISNISRVITEKYSILHKKRLIELKTFKANERLQLFQENHGDLFLRIPQKYIASYIGISETYVSKLKQLR